MERVIWKLTLPYVKQRVNRNLLCGSGNSNRDSVSTHSGGMGREIQKGGDICVYIYIYIYIYIYTYTYTYG